MGDDGPIPLEELAARLGRLRAETFGARPAEPEVVDTDTPILRAPQPDVGPPGAVPEPAPADRGGDDYAVKYAMEMAAHRDTTGKLLEEKDRTIHRLEESITELKAELDRARTRTGQPDRP